MKLCISLFIPISVPVRGRIALGDLADRLDIMQRPVQGVGRGKLFHAFDDSAGLLTDRHPILRRSCIHKHAAVIHDDPDPSRRV